MVVMQGTHPIATGNSNSPSFRPQLFPGLQFGAFEDADHVVLVIEYAAKGDLFDLLRHMGGRMKEADAVARIMTPFMKGLAYMHSLGVIHRDIKLENTLFSTNGTLKIADFGLSVDANHEAPVTRLGTLDYMSPGAINPRPTPHPCNPQQHPGGWRRLCSLRSAVRGSAHPNAVRVWLHASRSCPSTTHLLASGI